MIELKNNESIEKDSKITKNSSFEEKSTKSRKNTEDSIENSDLKPGDLCWVKITNFLLKKFLIF